MDLSFIIITNGKKPLEIDHQIKSIIRQNIPKYEIIIIGNTDNLKKYTEYSDRIVLIEDKYNADRGSLGGLRNNACKQAKYENLVISDDDMLFPLDWYKNLSEVESFEILTTCIRNPDGTRFWDNACYQSPEHGHVNLNYGEKDDFLYMSGGQSWLIKKNLWEKVLWDEELLIYKMSNLSDYSKGYHNEDTDFALRCRENNIKITHNKNIEVFHNDQTYTGIGRMVRRRAVQKNQSWCRYFNFPEKISLEFSINLINNSLHAEGADMLRFLIEKNSSVIASNIFSQFEEKLGGKLDNSTYYFDNHPTYNSLVNNLLNEYC